VSGGCIALENNKRKINSFLVIFGDIYCILSFSADAVLEVRTSPKYFISSI
jgi:hypothetical protein